MALRLYSLAMRKNTAGLPERAAWLHEEAKLGYKQKPIGREKCSLAMIQSSLAT
jgi:hypothetical protein